MGLKEDVELGVKGVLLPEWAARDGQVVPEASDIALGNGAVRLDSTYLYADMADSTGLAQGHTDWAAAKIIRCYLNAASRIIRARGGHIRSFDGDRVMGIFVGGSKNTSAVKAAMNISWAVSKVINPALKEKWNLKWQMDHGVGIDTGSAMLVRGGIYGENDIVSVGKAPNVAAKLSEIRGGKTINISAAVYDQMAAEVKISKESNMWTEMGTQAYGGTLVKYLGSSYSWQP
ncbi:adenylate/guanylate cyclase domain-containing protein [Paenarthrobacter nitroguajacolicus]|uniref:adenylate/guanylate cyclase domain-containing protein n=1 Tax=Paenarthrobacter nitroguajacolicus TaxID=211146 RepID=UPI00342A1F8A